MPKPTIFPKVLKFSAPVELTAAEDGEQPKRPSFEMVAYTGVPMNAGGFYSPVVVELSGVKTANAQIPILLDHDASRIIGQGEAKVDTASIRVSGSVLGEDADANKVVSLAKNGFKWQVSIGASVTRREFLEAGKKAVVNGREVSGPLMIARESLLQEVSFVAIGADQATSAAVAASHSLGKVTGMDPKFNGWLEANGYEPESLSAQQLKPLEAAWKIEANTVRTPKSVNDVLATAEAETTRHEAIANITAQFLAETPQRDADFIAKIRALADLAIEANWSADKYDTELLRASRHTRTFRPSASCGDRMSNNVLEAAICMAGRLKGHEKMFDDQTLQAAHDRFKGRIGLKQVLLVCAEANGYRGGYASQYGIEAHRTAFGMVGPQSVRASGFSTLTISTILSNTANKFLMEGWNAVDMTPLRITAIRPVSDLKTVTTVSLTSDLMYEKLGPGGEIKHGTLGELSYTNKADTYAKMLAITEDDIINDDLGALTAVPKKLGLGAGYKLNDIFWTEFLGAENEGFFASGNANVNTAVADMTIGGLAATETIFMNQTTPDGKPLGIMPAIIVVPTALKASAIALMDPQGQMITGASATIPNVNPFKGRFRVESSPYMSNSTYTGYSASAWYMLADPNELPMIEIAAYQGRVEPTVESASAEFNTLGVQMRGYSRIGVNLQEYRAAVKPDGGAS